MFRLDGRIALVTGGSRGIGRSCCEALGAQGATVVVNYVKGEAAAREVADAIAAKGGKADLAGFDVADSKAVDAAIGVRAWDPQARIILRIGPLDYPSFAALLPDHSGLQRLVSLVRAFLGYETGFAVNPVLAGPEVPPLRLDQAADPAPRLGWNTWMPAPASPVAGIPPRDRDEAVFEAEIVEAEELAGRTHQ